MAGMEDVNSDERRVANALSTSGAASEGESGVLPKMAACSGLLISSSSNGYGETNGAFDNVGTTDSTPVVKTNEGKEVESKEVTLVDRVGTAESRLDETMEGNLLMKNRHQMTGFRMQELSHPSVQSMGL